MTSYSGQQDRDSVADGLPVPQVTCCLCRRPVPPAHEVVALDAEWQRRFTSMVGVLACEECVLEAEWKCHDETGDYVSGHIPATGLPPQTQDVDSWSHLLAQGSQVAMIKQFTDPAPQQVATSIPSRVSRVDLSEQRTELMGLIDAWQATRPSRSKAAK